MNARLLPTTIASLSAVPIVAATCLPSVTAATMAEVDRLAVETYGIGLLQMMEQAGSHLAEVVRLELGGTLDGRAVVVAVGPGNNGGGGLVAARHLANRGARVRVVLANPALRMTGAGRAQMATLLAMGLSCSVVTHDLAPDELDRVLGGADLIVDAILGYNGRGAPRGGVERLIGAIERAGRPVVSLDLPSGLDADSGATPGSTVTADATLTLALPKAGLLTRAGLGRAGRIYVGDLGLPAALYASLGITIGPVFGPGRILRMDLSA